MPSTRPVRDAAPASVAVPLPAEQGRLLASLCAIAAVAFACAVAALPAAAQSGQNQSGGSTPQSSGHQGQTGRATGQERLRQQLTQAGFQDVRILDTAYLVQARTQDGNTVVMMINPPNGGQQTSGTPGSRSSAAGSSGGASPSGSGGSGGQSNTGRTQ